MTGGAADRGDGAAYSGPDSNGAAAPAQANGSARGYGLGYGGAGGPLRRPGKSVSLASLGSDEGDGYPPPTTRSEDGERWCDVSIGCQAKQVAVYFQDSWVVETTFQAGGCVFDRAQPCDGVSSSCGRCRNKVTHTCT